MTTKKPANYTNEAHKTSFKIDFRERLLENGAASLNDSELLAIILRTGALGQNVSQLAGVVLKYIDRNPLAEIDHSLRGIKGMGNTKIATLLAAFELGRRYYGFAQMRITKPTDIIKMVQHYASRQQEQFVCVSLNGANEILATRVVSVGILNRALVHPREVFAGPITDRAASIIICHNHPSGNVEPSEADIFLTHRLYSAGQILGINIFDHLILTPGGKFLSFVQEGISLSSNSVKSKTEVGFNWEDF